MPTYEYECQKCGHEFERFQSMTEEPLKRCPKCKGKVVRKIGTGAGLLFKGSGFYITDYRSENYKKGATADKPASTSETKSDASSAKAAKDTKKPPKTAKKDA